MRAKPAAYYFAVGRSLRVNARKIYSLGEEGSAGREQRAAIKYPAKLEVFPDRVRLSWKHMDTLYETLLHASTLIRNFIERKRASPQNWSCRRSGLVVAICQILIKIGELAEGLLISTSSASTDRLCAQTFKINLAKTKWFIEPCHCKMILSIVRECKFS